MSRTFVGTSSQSIDLGSAIAAQPCTMACWFKPTSFAATATLVSLSASAAALELNTDTAGKIRAVCANGGSGTAVSTTAATLNTWNHACGTFFNTVLRTAYLNGAGKGTNSTAITAPTLSTTDIGRLATSTPTQFFTGEIAHVAIWSVCLTDAEVAALAAGADPRTIEPAFLVAYLPLLTDTSDQIGSAWTNNGTTAGADDVTTAPSAAPTSVSAAAPVGSTCTLNWTPPSGTVDSYEVDIDWTDGTFTTFTTRPCPNASSAVIPGLMPSTQYWFRVRAWNLGGAGPNSSIVTATTGAGTAGKVYPGPAWMGRGSSGGTVPADPSRTTFKPTCHFADWPFQDASADFTIPICSYARGGVASVKLWVGGNTFTLPFGVQTYPNELPFPAYIGTLDISEIPLNGFIDVYAIATPTDGTAQQRVVGPWRITAVPNGYDNNIQQIVKYVGPAGTDDGTAGRGDTAGNPYLTVSFARTAIASAANRQSCGGGVIKLLTGSYAHGAATENVAFATPDRWLTIEADTGQTATFTSQGSTNGIRTQHEHLKGVSWANTTAGAILAPAVAGYAIWLEDMTITGPGAASTSGVIANLTSHAVYYTRCSATGLQDGFRFGASINARSCTCDGLLQITFDGAVASINCTAHATNDLGSLTLHPDGIFGGSTPKENVLIYGFHQYDTATSQGIFYKGTAGGSTNNDFAIVNCDTDSVWAFEDYDWSHLVVLNNTVRGATGQLRFTDNTNPNTENLTGSYFDIERNIFFDGYSEADLVGGVSNMTRDWNFFAAGSPIGTNAVTGTPAWDSTTGIPTNGGNLLTGTASLTTVPIDRLGNVRSTSNAAMGAYAAASEAPSGGSATNGLRHRSLNRLGTSGRLRGRDLP